jgi:hypothetical protein
VADDYNRRIYEAFESQAKVYDKLIDEKVAQMSG